MHDEQRMGNAHMRLELTERTAFEVTAPRSFTDHAAVVHELSYSPARAGSSPPGARAKGAAPAPSQRAPLR